MKRLVFFMLALAPMVSAASTGYVSEWQFQALQLTYQYDSLTKRMGLEVESGLDAENQVQQTLFELGIDDRINWAYAKHFGDFLRGDIQIGGVCGLSVNANVDRSVSALEARIELLVAGGERPLFTAIELYYLGQIVKDMDSAAGDAGSNDLESICTRIQKLSDALEIIAIAPQQFDPTTFVAAVNRKLEVNKAHVFDNAGLELKAAFKPYVMILVGELNDTESRLRQVFNEQMSSANFSISVWATAVQNSLLDIVLLQAYLQIYDQFMQLPDAFRERIESPALIAEAQSAASARRVIASTEYRLSSNGDGLSRDLSKLAEVRESYRVIRRYMDLVKVELNRNVSELPKVELEALAREVTNQLAGGVCDQLTAVDNQGDFGPNSWGELPSTQHPIGFRFTASPDLTKRSTDIVLYQVQLELLVQLPETKYLGACGNQGNTAFRALDTGMTVDYVVRDEDFSRVSKGFRRLQIQANSIVSDVIKARKAFKGIGMLGDWINNSPYWDVSEDFQNVSVTLPLRETELPVALLRDSDFVFDLADVSQAMCDRIVTQTIPGVVNEWSQYTRVPLGADWNLELATGTSAVVKSHGCPVQQSGELKPILSSYLGAELDMQLSGTLDGAVVTWGASVFVEMLNDDVSVKGYRLDAPPKAIRDKLDEVANELTVSINDLPGVSLRFIVNPPGYLEQLDNLSIPVLLQVTTDQCAGDAVPVTIGIPDLSLSVDEQSLLGTVNQLGRCQGERLIEEVVIDQIDCEDIAFAGFGLRVSASDTRAKSIQGGKFCALAINTSIAGKTISLSNILVSATAAGKLSYDFSKVQDNGSLSSYVESQVLLVLGDVAEQGLEITNPRFGAASFMVDVTLNRPGLFGTVSFGTVSIDAKGKITVESDLKRIFADRIAAEIERQLTPIARRILPSDVERVEIHVSLRDKLSAHADVAIRVHDDIPLIPGRIDLLPKPDVSLQIDKDGIRAVVEAELTALLGEYIQFSSGPVRFGLTDVQVEPDYDITIAVFAEIKLDALGEIKADPILISKNGVEFNGKLEVRLEFVLPLVPGPVPVFLTRPGVFYDFDEEQVGALGALTIVAPPMSEVLQIDGSLSTNKPEEFLKQLVLTGDLILMDTIPAVTVKGVLDFENTAVTFEGRTSPMLAKIFSASIDGALLPKEEIAELNSEITIFDVNLFRTNVALYLNKCPVRCIQGSASADILIGEGTMSAEFGPFWVDGIVNMGFELKLFGRKLGKADFEAEIYRASLDAEVLEHLKFSIATPSLKQMTPEYVAAVIASLLNIDIKNVLVWLKNPEVKLAPAGDPSSGPATPPANGNSNSSSSADATGNGNAGGGAQGQGSAAGSTEPTAEKVQGGNNSVLDDAPSQRTPQKNGNAARACDWKNRSYGVVYQPRGHNRRHYSAWLRGLSDEQFNPLCGEKGRKPGRLTTWWGASDVDVYYINDNYRQIETNAHFSYPHRPRRLSLQGNFENDEYFAEDYFSPYKVVYQAVADEEKEHRSNLQVRGRQFEVRPTSEVELVEVDTKFLKEDTETWSNYFDYLDEATDPCALATQSPRNRFIDQQLKHGFREQSGKSASCIVKAESRLALFWSSKRSVTLSAHIAKNVVPRRANEFFSTWVDQSGQNILFLRQCLGRGFGNDGNNCVARDTTNDFNEMNQRAAAAVQRMKQGLSNNQIVALSPDEAEWFLNDAIPYIVTGGELPERGTNLRLDKQVASCDISELSYTEEPDRLKYRVSKNTKQGSEYVNIVVEKYGQHESWASSNDVERVALMGNLLACEDSPQAWLADHRVWLELPASNDPLLFFQSSASAGDSYKIKAVAPGQSFRAHRVPKYNPYFLQQNMPFDIDLKQRLWREVQAIDKARLSIYLNKSQRLEIVELSDPDKAEVTYEARRYSCLNSSDCSPKPLEGPDQLNLNSPLEMARLTNCLSRLPWRSQTATMKEYLALEDPLLSVGVGPLVMLRGLDTNTNFDCRLN